MKNHHAPLILGTLVLLAGTFQQEAVRSQPASQTSRADRKSPQPMPQEWKEFFSREGGFSILMPGTPKEEIETKEFPVVGKAVSHMFGLVDDSGFYMAGYVEIPGLAQQSQEFCDDFGAGFLKSIGEGIADGAGGKVVKDTDISAGNRLGREIIIEVPGGLLTGRAYFVKRRGYQLLAAPSASGSDPGNIKKFLDSFKLPAD
jgi:hypothetical protein